MSGERRRKFVGTGQCCSHRGYHLVTKSWFFVRDRKSEKAWCMARDLPWVLHRASRETRAGASRIFNMLLTAWSQNKIKLHTKLGLLKVSRADLSGLGVSKMRREGSLSSLFELLKLLEWRTETTWAIKCRWLVFQKMSLRWESWSSQLDF